MDIESQLRRDEGEKLVPYKDIYGWWTIGIGYWLGTKDEAHIPTWARNGITKEKSHQLLTSELEANKSLFLTTMPWMFELPEVYLGVILNMAFNLGPTKLAQFHDFLNLMKDREFEEAAQDLKKTAVYKQLPERYGRLVKQLETGEWQ